MQIFTHRGKVKSTGRWITGYYVKANGRHFISLPLDMISSGQVVSEDLIIDLHSLGPFLEVLPETVSACTNKKDRNGNKIYEGDVVQVSGGSNYFAVIEFDESCGCYFVVNHDVQLPSELSNMPSKSLKIVGNVVDNGQLLHSRAAWR